MYLIIHTAQFDKIELGIANTKGEVIAAFSKQVTFHESEKLLPSIITFLKREKKSLHDLKAIAVHLGPGGSFTGLRVGVVTANALAYSLDIPNVGVPAADNLEEVAMKGFTMFKKRKKPMVLVPEYGKKPNITLPKSK